MNNTRKRTMLVGFIGLSLLVMNGAYAMKKSETQFIDNNNEKINKKGSSPNPRAEIKKEEEKLGRLKFDKERQEYYYGNILLSDNKDKNENSALIIVK